MSEGVASNMIGGEMGISIRSGDTKWPPSAAKCRPLSNDDERKIVDEFLVNTFNKTTETLACNKKEQ